MEHKPFEEDDPLELIGVEVSGPFATEDDGLEEMARTFIDEYARMGWNREQLLKLFRDPFYQGPHAIYQATGEAFIQRLIAERIPEDRLAAVINEGCPGPGNPLCDVCPVGRSLGQTQCPIRRTERRIREWLKARFVRRLS